MTSAASARVSLRDGARSGLSVGRKGIDFAAVTAARGGNGLLRNRENQLLNSTRGHSPGWLTRAMSKIFIPRYIGCASYVCNLWTILLCAVFLQPTMEFTPVWKKASNRHVCIGLDR